MQSKKRELILILFGVVIIAGIGAVLYTREPQKPPASGVQIREVAQLGAKMPEALRGVIPGATVKQSQVRRLTDGSEQSVIVYSSSRSPEEFYGYFKKEFAANKLSLVLDSVRENDFTLGARGLGNEYTIFVAQNGPTGSSVHVSLIRR